jgi:hypothetical protein
MDIIKKKAVEWIDCRRNLGVIAPQKSPPAREASGDFRVK